MKLSTVIMLVSVAIYLLRCVSVDFEYLPETSAQDSLLAFLGGKLAFLFAPIHLSRWEIASAFFSGIFAKEAIVSTLCLVLPEGLVLSAPQCAALIVFTLLYTPCVVALDAVRVEFGLKFAALCAVKQFLIALVCCYAVYYVLTIRWLQVCLALCVAFLACGAIAKIVCAKNAKRLRDENFYGKN